jgi:hypothetical protein
MNRFTKVRSSSLSSSIQRSGTDCDIDKMKAHFRFIYNNKMKADFHFMKSVKRCRAPRAASAPPIRTIRVIRGLDFRCAGSGRAREHARGGLTFRIRS